MTNVRQEEWKEASQALPSIRQAIDEEERLEALLEYDILDSRPDARWNQLVRILRESTGMAWSTITFVDRERQWFKATDGLAQTETPRSISFCSVCMHSSAPLIVEDAELDARFRDNPMVTGPSHLRFYAGFPIFSREGYGLGSVCVIDRKPRTLFAHHLQLMRYARDWVQASLEVRRLDRLTESGDAGFGAGELERLRDFARHRAEQAWSAVTTLADGHEFSSARPPSPAQQPANTLP